jgi:hypothetical protein
MKNVYETKLGSRTVGSGDLDSGGNKVFAEM